MNSQKELKKEREAHMQTKVECDYWKKKTVELEQEVADLQKYKDGQKKLFAGSGDILEDLRINGYD